VRITILGGWKEDAPGEYPLIGSRENFVSACEAIGKRLASERQAVLVGTDSPSSADLHIVRGIIDVAQYASPSYPLIHVIEPKDGGFLFGDLWQQYPYLFTSYPRKLRLREAAKIVSVQEADSVLAIGGSDNTYLAGLATIIARKTLVPIASFGGASRQLLEALERHGSVPNIQEFLILGGPWSAFLMETALRLTGMGKKPQVLIIHGRSDDRYKLGQWLHHDLKLPRPTVMAEEFQASEPLPIKFERLAAKVDAAIALATPDDLGALQVEEPLQLRPRARQNVWLEVGWFWGRLGRSKILVLCKGSVDMPSGVDIPSDLSGIEVLRYTDTPIEAAEKIREFIRHIQYGA
jgi:hypothetical protein